VPKLATDQSVISRQGFLVGFICFISTLFRRFVEEKVESQFAGAAALYRMKLPIQAITVKTKSIDCDLERLTDEPNAIAVSRYRPADGDQGIRSATRAAIR
jgi:hypothetical protein